MNANKQIGRIAYRVEGDHWNAYWAPSQTSMLNAVYLGSIRMTLVLTRPERKEAFMTLMRECFGDTVEEKLGFRPAWGDPRAAPENERSSNA